MVDPSVDAQAAEIMRQHEAAVDDELAERLRREVADAYERGHREGRDQALRDAIEQVRRSSSPQDAERRIVELDAEEGS